MATVQNIPSTPPPAYGTLDADSQRTDAAAASAQPAQDPAHTSPNNVPPGYEHGGYPQEPPPSYYSLYGHMKDMRDQANSPVEFLKKLVIFFVGTVTCTVCVGIFIVIPVAMIIIGSVHKDDCPVEKYIPIYLIVGGSVGLLKNILNLCHRCRHSNNENAEDNEHVKQNPLDGLLNCFNITWFICGCVWVYRTFQPGTDKDSQSYCDPTVYWFAFWLLTAVYIVLGFMFCCLCCAGIWGWRSGEQEPGGGQQQPA